MVTQLIIQKTSENLQTHISGTWESIVENNPGIKPKLYFAIEA